MTVGEIFRQYGDSYLQIYGKAMPPSHKRAINDLAKCRTDKMGTVHWHCNKCGKDHFSFMPCRNRSCPNCQNDKKAKWVIAQLEKKLPVEYFMATFTVPEYLRAVARSNQKAFYTILFNEAAGAIMKLAKDKKYMGGKIGIIGILHTWARNLAIHPHVHFLIPGAALSNDQKKIVFSKEHFLVYAPSLSKIFRAAFMKNLRAAGFDNLKPGKAFETDWVVDVRSVGSGTRAIEYVAKYVFKTALSNHNIIACKNGTVLYRYRDYETKKMKTLSLPVMEFMRRFLQHVLPKGFQKVRYYGILHPKNRLLFNIIRLLLRARFRPPQKYLSFEPGCKCPECGEIMTFIGKRRPP
jgi:uncharacterized OB-fold protein